MSDFRSDLHDITLHLHAETGKAILVSDDGDEDAAMWVPKSQVEVRKIDALTVEVTMPEWLAVDKGFL